MHVLVPSLLLAQIGVVFMSSRYLSHTTGTVTNFCSSFSNDEFGTLAQLFLSFRPSSSKALNIHSRYLGSNQSSIKSMPYTEVARCRVPEEKKNRLTCLRTQCALRVPEEEEESINVLTYSVCTSL